MTKPTAAPTHQAGTLTGAMAGWVLFLLLPSLLVSWSIRRTLLFQADQQHRRMQSALDSDCRKMVFQATPSEYARRVFFAPSPARSHRILGPCQHLEPGKPAPDGLVELSELREFLAGRLVPDQPRIERWKNRLGWDFDPMALRRSRGVPLPVSWERQPASLLWDSNGSATALVPPIRMGVFVSPSVADLAWPVLAEHLESSVDGGYLLDFGHKQWRGMARTRRDEVLSLLRAAPRQRVIRRQQEGLALHLERVSEGLYLFLERPLSRTVWGSPDGTALGFLLFGLTTGTLLFPFFARLAANGSIALKMLGIFGYLLLFPSLTLTVLDQTNRADRVQIREREILALAREHLMQFDEGFRAEEKSQLVFFRRLVEDPDLQRGRLSAFLPKVRKWFATGFLDYLSLMDWQRRRILLVTKTAFDEAFDLFQDTVGARIVGEAQGLSLEEIYGPRLRLVADWFVRPELGFSEYYRKGGTLHHFRLGRSSSFGFWMTTDPKASPRTALVTTNARHIQIARRYVTGNLVRNGLFRVLVRNRPTGRWLPPERGNADLDSLCHAVERTGEDQTGLVVFGGQRYLAQAMAGQKLEYMDLVALIPESVAQQAQGAGSVIRGEGFLPIGIGLSLLVGLAGALFLTRGLVAPLRHIGDGIRAMRSGQARFRIPISGDDEIATLGRTLNRFLEHREEMDSATVLQQILIPQSAPTVPGYGIALRAEMTDQLGGDYLDCFPIPGLGIGFLVGDVAGHGVGSALVMTMAKTIVYRHFQEGLPEERLLERLNDSLRDLMPKRQMMTFCFGVLNPETHEVVLRLAGHPYPVLWSAARRQAGLVGKPQMPLGLRPGLVFPEVRFRLEPGDGILLYSDALVEAPGPEGNPFGFDRLTALVEELSHLAPETFLAGVRETLTRRLAGGKVPDDLCLLVIRREVAP